MCDQHDGLDCYMNCFVGFFHLHSCFWVVASGEEASISDSCVNLFYTVYTSIFALVPGISVVVLSFRV